MDDLLTAKQLQEILRVDRTTIYRMLNDGRLTGIKVGGQWRFSRKEVDSLLSGAYQTEKRGPTLTTDVLPLHCVQPIQNVFAEIGGVGSVTTAPDGQLLTKISNPCSFCKLILQSESGQRACVASWQKLAAQPERPGKFVTCHAGLQYSHARIEVNNNLIAVLIAGQFYTQKPDEAEEAARVERLAAAYDIAPDALGQAAKDITVLDESRKARMGGWLEAVAHTFEDIAKERTLIVSRLRQIAEISKLDAE